MPLPLGPTTARDARAELHHRPLGEGLEADHAQLAESGQAHERGPLVEVRVEVERGQGGFCGHRLGFAAAAALALAQGAAVDGGLHHEASLVVGTFAADDAVAGWAAGEGHGAFLEAALGRLQGVCGQGFLDLRLGCAQDEVSGRAQAGVEVDGRHDGLEEAGQDRAAAALTGVLGSLTQDERVAEAEAPRDACQSARRDDGRAPSGEDALLLIAMAPEEGLGDDQFEHGVTKELEPLVRIGRALEVLVDVATVDERLGEERGVVEREAQPVGKLDGAGRHRPLSGDYWLRRSST